MLRVIIMNFKKEKIKPKAMAHCKRCDYKWGYTGNKELNRGYAIYVCCPRCRTTVKLN
jgi:hypothetical protein